MYPNEQKTDATLQKWDERRAYKKRYNKDPKVKQMRAQKVIEKLKMEKARQMKDQAKGLDYSPGMCGPTGEFNDKEEKSTKPVAICRYCGLKGHVRRTSKKCLQYKKRVASIVASGQETGEW